LYIYIHIYTILDVYIYTYKYEENYKKWTKPASEFTI